MKKLCTLKCSVCGAATYAEYDPDPLSPGDRIPAWQCVNIDCLHREN